MLAPADGSAIADRGTAQAGDAARSALLLPDLAEAHQFLALLDPHARQWHFRTFDDKGRGQGRNFVGTLDQHAIDLQLENSKGRGVFVVINDGGAKATDIERVRAVFADFDGAALPDQPGAHPHIVVESSAGKYHVYWLVDGLPLDQFKPVQRAIAARFRSDPAVCDLPRVMRLPGFIHRKGTAFRTTIIHQSGKAPHTADFIRQRFAPSPAPRPPAPSPHAGTDGVVIDTERHSDLLKLAARFARMIHFDGLSTEAVLSAMEAEAARGRWTREIPPDEVRRALDGALLKYRSGEWKQAGSPGIDALADSPQRRRLSFQRADELIANPKPLAWLIKGVLELDSFCLVFGDPGVGKSFLTIDLAASVAAGVPWNGRRVAMAPVFYIAGEGGNGLARRLRAWELSKNTHLTGAPLFVSTMPAALTDDAGAMEAACVVEQMIQHHGRPALIVLDTVARNFGPGDENSTKDMTAFVAACDRLREQTGACVLLVHHSGHGDKTRARGSIALKGALDWEYGLVKDAGAITMHCTKAKDAEPPDAMAFRLTSVDLGVFDEDGEPVTSAVLSPAAYMKPSKQGKAGRGKNQTKALRVLEECLEPCRAMHEKHGLDPDTAWVGFPVWRDACDKDGLDRKRFGEVARALQEQGFIAIDNDRVTRTDGYVYDREPH